MLAALIGTPARFRFRASERNAGASHHQNLVVECYIAAHHLAVDLMAADIHLAVAAAVAASRHLLEHSCFAAGVAAAAAADSLAAASAGLVLEVRQRYQ